MAHRSAWVEVVAGAALAASLELGCAQIFGIDSACVIGEAGCAAGSGGEANGGSGGSGAGGNGGAIDDSLGGSDSVGGSAIAACLPGEPSCTPDGGADLLCDQYCTEISAKCSAAPQYDVNLRRSVQGELVPECARMCPFIPKAQGESPRGNTLECRLDRLSAERVDRTDCFAAGRGGEDQRGSAEEDTCGSKCEAYCSLMQTLCPSHFGEFNESARDADDAAACAAECGRLNDRQEYDPTLTGADADDELGDPTVQCRLWHLGAAAIDAAGGANLDNTHCDHAVGVSRCLPAPPAP